MRHGVREVQEERFVPGGLLLKKLDRLSRQQRGDVAILRHALAVFVDRVL